MTQTRLEMIVAAHQKLAEDDPRTLAELVDQALASPSPRDFVAALRSPGLSVISEVKRRSPSAGALNLELVPAELASLYAEGGAACLSVLTDEEFFGGSPVDLREARAAVSVPVLRKDFTVDERDVADARIMGADAVLLIVAALTDEELHRCHQLAINLGLAALVEVHDRAELDRAKQIDGLHLLGVNQRNLHTFEITGEAFALRDDFPDDVVAVAESGIHEVEDAQRMADVGYDAILVGTALVTADDPVSRVRSFTSVTAR